MATCNNCGGNEFSKVMETSYSGHKGNQSKRDPTEKHVFACENCSKEGRKFVDGVDGSVTYSGAFR